jgi:hypothetical protein
MPETVAGANKKAAPFSSYRERKKPLWLAVNEVKARMTPPLPMTGVLSIVVHCCKSNDASFCS